MDIKKLYVLKEKKNMPAKYNDKFLYRGVNYELHNKNKGLLIPKNNNNFQYQFKYDGTIKYDGSATHGESIKNAIHRHELNQEEGFPDSGISTTPIFERAQFYATNGGCCKGVVYKINTELLSKYAVQMYRVSDYVTNPAIPEDCEVILIANNFKTIPEQVILGTICV